MLVLAFWINIFNFLIC